MSDDEKTALITALTMTVPEAARRLGLSRNSGYAAARAGQIPTVRIGRLLKVPVAALNQMLMSQRGADQRPSRKAR